MRTPAEELVLRRRGKPWVDLARQAIKEATEDAVAHVELLVGQLDGSSEDFIRMARSTSLKAANNRLDRLGQTIATHIMNARVDFYVASHEMRSRNLDERVHQIGTVPTCECGEAARDANIHGRSLHGDIQNAIASAKRRMSMSIHQVKSEPSRGAAILKSMKSSMVAQLESRVESWIADSSHAVHDAVGYSLLKPELRPSLGLL